MLKIILLASILSVVIPTVLTLVMLHYFQNYQDSSMCAAKYVELGVPRADIIIDGGTCHLELHK